MDLRALAALRICFGFLLITDLCIRAQDLVAHYTDQGVLPRVARILLYEDGSLGGRSHWWSLHMWSGTAWSQAFFFVLAFVFAVFLLFGYKTRFSTVISWVLLLSLHRRNPTIINAGDIYLHCLLFWAMFLPLGARGSVDAALRNEGEAPPPFRIATSATFAFLMQVFFMYVFTSALKNHGVWTREFSAMYYALNLDIFLTPLGRWLSGFPTLLKVSTPAVLVLEWVGPFLVLLPFWAKRLRLLIVPAFLALHLAILLTMNVGLFSWVCMAAWLPFLPSSVWDRVSANRAAENWRLLNKKIADQLQRGFLASTHKKVSREKLGHVPCLKLHRWSSILVLALLLYTGLWNLREMNFQKFEPWILPDCMNAIGRATGLDQRWNMFAPYPSTEDGWYVLRGKLYSGEEVNLWGEGEALPWQKPQHVSRTYRNQRWRKYLNNLYHQGHERHREYFAQWLKRRWDFKHREDSWRKTVRSIEIHYVLERTPPPGQSFSKPEPQLLWEERFGNTLGGNPETSIRVPKKSSRIEAEE